MPTPDSLSTGVFPQTQPIDRSAFGLQIQHQQIDAAAVGSNNGVGTRMAPNPSSLFSHPLSAGQFGGGTNAKMSLGAFTPSPTSPPQKGM